MLFNKNSVIGFSVDPFDYIMKGYEIASQKYPQYVKSLDTAMTNEGGNPSGGGKTFWGFDPNSNLSVQEQFSRDSGLNQFLFPDFLRTVTLFAEDVSASIDLGGNLEKARIKYTSIARGFFDFSRASKGLIRPVEYYCEDLNEIIAPNDTYKKEIGDQVFFFTDRGNKEYMCEPRQEGTTVLLEKNTDLIKYYLKSNNIYIPVDEDGKFITKKNGDRLRFTSTEKKVYAYRETLGGGLSPYVDLFVPLGGNWKQNTDYMFIRALPMMMVAQFLEEHDLPTNEAARAFRAAMRGRSCAERLTWPVRGRRHTTGLQVQSLADRITAELLEEERDGTTDAWFAERDRRHPRWPVT